MADEEDETTLTEEEQRALAPKATGAHIFFGSLEHREKERLAALQRQPAKEHGAGEEPASVVFEGGAMEEEDEEEDEEATGVAAGIAAGHISVPDANDMMELPEESRAAKERQEKLLKDLELARRAARLAVPTNDQAVRQRLRQLEQPITLFGEKEMERRDRLRQLMARLETEGELPDVEGPLEEDEEPSEDGQPKVELFYTEGSPELHEERKLIARLSLPRAAARIAAAKRRQEDPDEDEDAELDEVVKTMTRTAMQLSEHGDERPVSACALSPDPGASLLITGGWSGLVKVWGIPQMAQQTVFRAHAERITDVAFHPSPAIGMDSDGPDLATASADRTAKLWNLKGKEVRTFSGHLDRLARIAFHPSGRYLGTASFDKTWRLWHLETGVEMLLQEGHSRAVYGIAFHVDGSLVASCGLDALARVWDLRTGKSIMPLQGHVKPILGIDFSPNGYHLATAGEDHTCRIWDLRMRRSLYVIPAHSHLITQVKYEPSQGYFLVTSSHDNTARIWSGKDFKPVKTLAGHEGKILDVDISAEGQYITTAAYDRTIKLWAPDHEANELDA
ncbi:U4/U6 small nuclear ribonucleoprotein PRP4 [Klebsormidium nitens]|uniref:U4/U6 small nuclear ribonucleoprotein PRP4 n=1 Tax=Klebsormidium nitens TaxID=105231 RepID=A0A1Y1HKQ5_KLENI|nr:U4/U6 small nuclear ribonucleoprotein PRP4 [Klebsormidium nitens]|eukprot:GAQ77709.1 U4/U6 small nuclear ribonucleoprotein PRP4 [Klebsormidium nitens]